MNKFAKHAIIISNIKSTLRFVMRHGYSMGAAISIVLSLLASVILTYSKPNIAIDMMAKGPKYSIRYLDKAFVPVRIDRYGYPLMVRSVEAKVRDAYLFDRLALNVAGLFIVMEIVMLIFYVGYRAKYARFHPEQNDGNGDDSSEAASDDSLVAKNE